MQIGVTKVRDEVELSALEWFTGSGILVVVMGEVFPHRAPCGIAVLAVLLTACGDQPAETHSVAIRPLGGVWSVSESPVCGAVLDLPTDVPFELVTWKPGYWTMMYQVGPGDMHFPVVSCNEEPLDVHIVGIATDHVLVEYGGIGSQRDVIATTREDPPRYIIKHDLDVDHVVTLDFTRDGAPLEAREVTSADGATSFITTVITTALGAVHEHVASPPVAWTLPAAALADGDRQEVEVSYGAWMNGAYEWTSTFDLREAAAGTLTAAAPPAIDDARWTGAGVTVATPGTFNEWTMTDFEISFCDTQCGPSPWRVTKTGGWPGTVTGTADVNYPDVSAIPGFQGARPINANARVETTIELCLNESGVKRCRSRDVSK